MARVMRDLMCRRHMVGVLLWALLCACPCRALADGMEAAPDAGGLSPLAAALAPVVVSGMAGPQPVTLAEYLAWGPQPVRLASVGNPVYSRPVVVFGRGADAQARSIRGEGAENTAWVGHAVIGPDSLVGVLDGVIEGSGPSLFIVLTRDSGRTWVDAGRIDKPHYTLLFDGIHWTATGEGTVSLRCVDADLGPPDLRLGIYEYRTVDGGLTWTGPTFVPGSAR